MHKTRNYRVISSNISANVDRNIYACDNIPQFSISIPVFATST